MEVVLDTRSGRCSLRKWEQSQEALRCSLVPLDFQIAFAQRVGELPAAVDDSSERIGLPLDDRVGPIYASAEQFHATAVHVGVEAIFADSQLNARTKTPGRVTIEHRAERENQRIDAEAALRQERRASGPTPE